MSSDIIGITGAAGRIGTVLRAELRDRYKELRLLDTSLVGPADRAEVIFQGDIRDSDLMDRFAQGCDTVVHLAGIPDEAEFEDILEANIRGTQVVFEAARRQGVRRLVFASTNHVMGFYSTTEVVGEQAPVRPDSFYGVSKVFGEALGRLYHDKWGLEVVSLRIGSFRPEPQDVRQLHTWLGLDDAVELVRCSVEAEDVGFTVAYGISAVEDPWWVSEEAWRVLGYSPNQRARDHALSAEAMQDSRALLERHGGVFVDPDYRGGLG